MSLFINNHNGPIYNDCVVTINELTNEGMNGDATLQDTGAPVAPNDARSAKDILPIPHEGKYSEVRRYIEERKRFDEEFKTYMENNSLRDLCTRLTNEFGWFVDENSLQKNLNRNR